MQKSHALNAFLQSYGMAASRLCLGTAGVIACGAAAPVQKAWIPLGTAQNFAILSEAGVTDVPSSAVVGGVGTSPITGAAIHLTCSEVKGRISTVDSAGPACAIKAPATLTQAISDMKTAYTDAAGRTPTVKNLGAGNIGGLTLPPGVYAWTSAVNIPTALTLQGTVSGKGNVWIFQVAKTLNLANATAITLTRGASATFVFWQVGGAVTIGTGASFQGEILGRTSISMKTGATLSGRLLAQTGVTLQKNAITRK